jgi:hypothetical protein
MSLRGVTISNQNYLSSSETKVRACIRRQELYLCEWTWCQESTGGVQCHQFVGSLFFFGTRDCGTQLLSISKNKHCAINDRFRGACARSCTSVSSWAKGIFSLHGCDMNSLLRHKIQSPRGPCFPFFPPHPSAHGYTMPIQIFPK